MCACPLLLRTRLRVCQTKFSTEQHGPEASAAAAAGGGGGDGRQERGKPNCRGKRNQRNRVSRESERGAVGSRRAPTLHTLTRAHTRRRVGGEGERRKDRTKEKRGGTQSGCERLWCVAASRTDMTIKRAAAMSKMRAADTSVAGRRTRGAASNKTTKKMLANRRAQEEPKKRDAPENVSTRTRAYKSTKTQRQNCKQQVNLRSRSPFLSSRIICFLLCGGGGGCRCGCVST